MILKHYCDNPLKLTRSKKIRLINYFWKHHKFHPTNNRYHPNHNTCKDLEDFDYLQRDITQLYEYPLNILNTNIEIFQNLQVGLVAATAPFNPHTDLHYKQFLHLLILHNEGTRVIGSEQTNSSFPLIQNELDLLVMDQHQLHELIIDNRAWKRTSQKNRLEAEDYNLFVALHFSYKKEQNLRILLEDFEKMYQNLFKVKCVTI